MNKKKDEKILKLSSVIHRYELLLKASGRSEATIVSYINKLNKLSNILKDPYINEINQNSINQSLIEIYNENKRKATTMNQIRSIYKKFFKWCVEIGFLSKDPSKSLAKERAIPQKTIPINKNDIDKLFETIDKSNDVNALRDKTILSIYAYTGVRRNEATYLQIKDVNLEECIIFIPSSKSGKNKRHTIIPKKLAKILKVYLASMRNNKTYNPNQWLFPGRDGKTPINSRQVHNRFLQWRNEAKLSKDLTLHSFRASFAMRIYNTSKNVMLVSKMMGHQSISSTEPYLSYCDDNVRNTVEKAFK